jgi:hypothetical protein
MQSEYLSLLHRVVAESTVCLMAHERRQTLSMIDRLAYQVCVCEHLLSKHQHYIIQSSLSTVTKYYEQACHAATCGHTPRQTLLYQPRNATYWLQVV